MKALVIYDSYFGNTQKIAEAVGASLNAVVKPVGDVTAADRQGIDLLVVGSPTRAFRPSEKTQKFLASLPAGGLQGVKVAAFDTRINPEDTNSGFLKFMVKLFGYAAKPIANALAKKGGALVTAPEGFFVTASEGPLKDGEIERAGSWAKGME